MSEEFDRLINKVTEKPVRLCLIELQRQVIGNKLTLQYLSSKVEIVERELLTIKKQVQIIEKGLSPENVSKEVEALRRIEAKVNHKIENLKKAWMPTLARLGSSTFKDEINELQKIVDRWDRTRRLIHKEYKKMRKALKTYRSE